MGSLLTLLLLWALVCQGERQHRHGKRLCVPHVHTPPKENVLLLVSDNMRPVIGAYGAPVHTPNLDALVAGGRGSMFRRAYCQEAWCSPSRNSFLTSRYPAQLRVWNFRNDFRNGQSGNCSGIKSFPQYFMENGYFATSFGKVFHPNLPLFFDYPCSWSENVTEFFEDKVECDGDALTCAFRESDIPNFNSSYATYKRCDIPGNCPNLSGIPVADVFRKRLNPHKDGYINVDYQNTDLAINKLRLLAESKQQQPFFLALGFTSSRLPWSFPVEIASKYYPLETISLPKHTESHPNNFEWIRQVSLSFFQKISNNKTLDNIPEHDMPMSDRDILIARQAYFAAATWIDMQVGRLVEELKRLGLDDSTTIVFMADHGQSLGDGNLYNMMTLTEASTRVPIIIRPAPRRGKRYESAVEEPVESVDVYPTVAKLAGLPPPPGAAGKSLVDVMEGKASADPDPAAFSQITRCSNCFQAYPPFIFGIHRLCNLDQVDKNYFVPCLHTCRADFDFMGYSIRTRDWRYITYCGWRSDSLCPDWSNCTDQLYPHQDDDTSYIRTYDDFDWVNVNETATLQDIRESLRERLRAKFVSLNQCGPEDQTCKPLPQSPPISETLFRQAQRKTTLADILEFD